MSNKTLSRQEELTYLSSYLSKLLKQMFGKGPETCFSTLNQEYLLCHIRNFITPLEETLLKRDKHNLVLTTRDEVLQSLLEKFNREVELTLDINVNRSFHDWDYTSNKGLILLKGDDNRYFADRSSLFNNTTYEQIKMICSSIHKKPAETEVIKMSPSTYIIKLTDILYPFEKHLFLNGYDDILGERLRALKIEYLKTKKAFEDERVFNRPIEDLFITWDYEQDCCYLCFYLY